MASVIGNSLLTTDGDIWRRSRRVSQPVFGRKRLAHLADVIVDKTCGPLHTDGTTLASAGADSTVRLWSTPASWVAAACDVAGRNLSQREWNTFIGPVHPYVRLCPGLPAGPSAPNDAKAATYGYPLRVNG